MQHVIKMPHNTYSSTLPHRKLPTKRNLLHTAVASNHPPCIKPWNRGGATFATKDKPIGLKNNSAIVRIR